MGGLVVGGFVVVGGLVGFGSVKQYILSDAYRVLQTMISVKSTSFNT